MPVERQSITDSEKWPAIAYFIHTKPFLDAKVCSRAVEDIGCNGDA